MITIKDVARHLGISVSTVSRCLNNYPDVKKETRERIFAGMEELNYVPSIAARSITLKKIRSVGMTIPDVRDSLFAAAADAAEDFMLANGYSLLFGPLNRRSDRLIAFLKRSMEMRLDGLIITPDSWNAELLHALQVLRHFGMPVVSLRRKPPGELDLPYVDGDHYRGARMMTEHLLSLGHRRIGHIAVATPIGLERRRGYEDLMREHSLGEAVVATDTNSGRIPEVVPSGHRAMRELLERYPRLTAVFASNDYLAMGAMEYCHRTEIRVPDNISIAGFDNNDYADFSWFRLTTITVDRGESGARAAKMILSMIEDKEKRPESILVRPVLIERDSVRAV